MPIQAGLIKASHTILSSVPNEVKVAWSQEMAEPQRGSTLGPCCEAWGSHLTHSRLGHRQEINLYKVKP